MTPEIAQHIENDRKNWEKEITPENWHIKENSWGNPYAKKDQHGNYKMLGDMLRDYSWVYPNHTILEIGSFTGKWIDFLPYAKKIICVDIIDNGFPVIEARYPGRCLEFYKTRGNELFGIENDSVNLIFSFDSLMRTPKDVICDYIRESYRVLSAGGEMIFQLPDWSKPVAIKLGFTELYSSMMHKFITDCGFKNFDIDPHNFKHSFLLKAWK